ncbi:MAG: phosphoribosylformylglycinamidine synthase subunit PurS [Gemmatimonadota bacterium]|nr:phosphoribosylformylglycinamidine synthase subunit PurS [Gemmatimonadota bacterium]
MSQFAVSVHILPRQGLLDPQGVAVAGALHTLGFAGVSEARLGRYIVIELSATDERAARQAVGDMCERLLANPVTEDFEIAAVRELVETRR